MKVFISWSGDLSRELGEILRDWLPSVMQNLRPFFTPNDIEKGARWGNEISLELESSGLGIFCLTKENVSKPWIMFEAGALSKQVEKSRVCPILFDIEPSDLEGPLTQFQATPFNQAEFAKLVKSINQLLPPEQRLGDGVLEEVFEMWWPKLNAKITELLERNRGTKHSGKGGRKDREVLDEILELVRLNSRTLPLESKTSLNTRATDELSDAYRMLVEYLYDNRLRKPDLTLLKLIDRLSRPIDYLVRRGHLTNRTVNMSRRMLGSMLEASDSSDPESITE